MKTRFLKLNIEAVELAGAVHDIGKLTVPKEILDKPQSLRKQSGRL